MERKDRRFARNPDGGYHRPKKSYPVYSRSPFRGSGTVEDVASNPPSSLSERRCFTSINYVAAGGGNVNISLPINPWNSLGLHPSSASREAVKEAFRNKITQQKRQNRAEISIANHILTSTANRYERQKGTNNFFIRKRDQFVLAACGHTQELASRIAERENLVEEGDEHGRTLLYIACKSGFYDMCRLLLEKGASVNQVQRDGSTPLHAAAYYGQTLVVGLLLECGARIDIRNKWGSTALMESSLIEIRSLIQTTSSDRISSLAAKLREKQLVSSVRFVELKGKVVAKELLRDPRSLDPDTRAQWNSILQTWEPTWHGTRYKNLQSIIENGLIPSGTNGIKPGKGHYRLGEEYFGIKNWAAAIFLSPSLLYSAHAAYSERVLSQRVQWCVLVRAYCKPRSYKAYDPTVFQYKPMDGEPDLPEYRVPVTDEDRHVILRVESSRSVVVRSLVFVRLSFLESQEINFEEVAKLFAQ